MYNVRFASFQSVITDLGVFTFIIETITSRFERLATNSIFPLSTQLVSKENWIFHTQTNTHTHKRIHSAPKLKYLRKLFFKLFKYIYRMMMIRRFNYKVKKSSLYDKRVNGNATIVWYWIGYDRLPTDTHISQYLIIWSTSGGCRLNHKNESDLTKSHKQSWFVVWICSHLSYFNKANKGLEDKQTHIHRIQWPLVIGHVNKTSPDDDERKFAHTWSPPFMHISVHSNINNQGP